MRRVVCVLGIVTMLWAAAPASARGTRSAFGPLLGYTFDPTTAATQENVPEAPQPDWWQLPTFNIMFGPASSPMFDPASGRYESVALGNDSGGNARVYVSSSSARRVYVYDAQMPINLGGSAPPPQPLSTFGTQAGPGTLQDPAGLSYYKGEVYVVDRYHPNPGQDRVVVYDSDGNYNREFPLLNPRGLFDMTGIDISGHEAWVTGELCGGFGGIVEIFDADTGALKGIVPHIGHAPTGDPTKPCAADADPSSWWDLALVPELNAAVAQYRLIFRGLLAQLSTPDAELTCLTCFRHLWLDGVDAVWGMHWLLAVDGATDARGSSITEYGIDNSQAGTPFLEERRHWTPRQAGNGGVRDVAYLNRDTRIDWQGALTGHDWLRGSKCLDYVVSDGDIFAVGRQGEHWYELARGFQKVEFSIDGVLNATQTTNPGTYCLNTATVPSGVHTLTAEATVAGGAKVVTITNDELKLDNTLPLGTVNPLPRFVHGTQQVTGTGSDAHSGLKSWTLQALGSGSWRDLCSLAAPDPTGAFACDWHTDDGGWPDGLYRLHTHVGDQSSDGGNQTDSSEITTTVDNTPPGIGLSGDLWDRRDGVTIWFDDSPQTAIHATDGGSGVASVEVQVDGVRSDFASQACPGGGCALDHTYTFNAAMVAGGDHTITVIATDQLGLSTTSSWTVHVDSQPEADAPDPAPLDAQPVDVDIQGPREDDPEVADTVDSTYGAGDLDDFCTSDPDTPDMCVAPNAATVAAMHEPPLIAVPDVALPGTSIPATGPSLQPGHTGWGLANQNGTMFNDSRFAALGVSRVRIAVAYDVVPRGDGPARDEHGNVYADQDTATRDQVDGFIAAAHRTGKQVLVSFWHSRGHADHLPSVKEFSHAVRQFRQRYPAVKEFTAWNEPNFAGHEPTAGDPFRAGRFWRNLNWQCQSAGCVVAAGEFRDKGFTKNYLDRYLSGAGHLPSIWAWHAYQDGHDQAPTRLTKLLQATTYRNHQAPVIWLSEQGGKVHAYGLARATDDFQYLLGLPAVSDRITRFYAYGWKGDAKWDSGLLDYQNNSIRHMYNLFKAKSNP